LASPKNQGRFGEKEPVMLSRFVVMLVALGVSSVRNTLSNITPQHDPTSRRSMNQRIQK
jgi:hypothetical protein